MLGLKPTFINTKTKIMRQKLLLQGMSLTINSITPKTFYLY